MEFETNKKNKLTGVLVLIIILLLGCVGFLGYKCYFSDNNVNRDTPPIDDKTPTEPIDDKTPTEPIDDKTPTEPIDGNDEQPKESNNKIVFKDESEYPVETMDFEKVESYFSGMDLDVKNLTPTLTRKELSTNFKKLDKSKNNYKIVLNCTYYDKSSEWCDTWNVTVNSTIKYAEGGPGRGFLYNYNDYLIVIEIEDSTGATKLNIYDNKNNKVYNNGSAISELLFNSFYGAEIQAEPIIRNGILYFAEDPNDDDKINVVSVDLTDSKTIKYEIIGKLEASHAR